MQATVIKTRDELDDAGPGIYVIESGTPAYYPAKAFIEDGSANQLGEFFDDRGNHVITIELGGHDRGLGATEPSEKRKISIGREFFVSAIKDYTDWKLKWWREAIQNSVDAGATVINCGTQKLEDGSFLIYCDDNGRGMDEDTIVNKFLVLGGSTKTATSGTAGGFGKAKELLLLPWISWRIISRGTDVYGAGIDYEIKSVEERVGTRLEVVMPADQTTGSPEAMSFIMRCYLPHIVFTVDGKEVEADLRGQNLVELAEGKAEIYFTPKSVKFHEMFIRTKGLYMFSRYLGETPGVVIVELIAPSIEILTANRDGFRDYVVTSLVDNLARRVAKDNMSALKSKLGLIRKKYEGTGRFKAKNAAADILANISPAQTKITPASEEMIMQVVANLSRAAVNEIMSAAVTATTTYSAMLDQKFTGAAHVEAALRQLVWQPDFFIVNKIERFVVPKRFFPETMKPRIVKLIRAWTELCRFVLMQLGSTAEYGVGFVFDDDTGAEAIVEKNERTDEEEHWLMINPYKNRYGDVVLSPSQDNDLKWMYAAAIHECTHIADGISYHDESFAAALTRNMARCADGYRKIKQIVGGIRTFGETETDTE